MVQALAASGVVVKYFSSSVILAVHLVVASANFVAVAVISLFVFAAAVKVALLIAVDGGDVAAMSVSLSVVDSVATLTSCFAFVVARFVVVAAGFVAVTASFVALAVAPKVAALKVAVLELISLSAADAAVVTSSSIFVAVDGVVVTVV